MTTNGGVSSDVGQGPTDTKHAVRRIRLRAWWSSLSFRLAVLLSLALVPLGLIGVNQTVQLQSELDHVRVLNLQVTTTDIARRDGEAILTAIGAAEALATTYLSAPRDSAECSAALTRFAARDPRRLSFVGFVPLDGLVTCSTRGTGMDLTVSPVFDERMARRTSFVTATASGLLSEEAALHAHSPVFDAAGVFQGLVVISVVDRGPLNPSPVVPGGTAVDHVFLDAEGDLLSISDPDLSIADLMPKGVDLASLIAREDRVLVAENGNGQMRRFALAEAVESVVYVIGSTPYQGAGALAGLRSPEAFALFMWLVSLVMVFAVVEASLVGPLRNLAARMRRYGETRRFDTTQTRHGMPAELRVIDTTFRRAAERLMREEADLTDALHDKNVLLMEVHHRVKNNLQMISSMINLQIRQTDDPDTGAALEKVGGRIASLAAVHRLVYAADRSGAVWADHLLREIVVPLTGTVLADVHDAHRPRLKLDLSAVRLTPDQTVPTAMLVVEALTTALRWCVASGDDTRWVRVSLWADEHPGEAHAQDVHIEVACNPDFDVATQDASSMTTLGERLIRGFARQLRGKIDFAWHDGVNNVALSFRALPFPMEGKATHKTTT